MSVIVSIYLYPVPHAILNCSRLVEEQIYAWALSGQVLPEGCLASDIFLTIFEAPGDIIFYY